MSLLSCLRLQFPYAPLLLVLLTSLPNPAISQTDMDFMLNRTEIRGKVRKVAQATALIPPGQSPWKMSTAIPLDIQMIEFTPSGEYKSRKVHIIEYNHTIFNKQYEQNAKGQTVSAKVFNSGNEVIATFQYSYDNQGRLIEMSVTGADGKTRLQQLQYTYQESQTEVRQQFFNMASKNLLHVLNHQQWTGTQHFDSLGALIETTVRKYHPKGFVSQIITKDTSGKMIGGASFEYEFDQQGNWTRRLSRDWLTDEYNLTVQTIVYEKEKDRKPSLKELQGQWVGLLYPIKFKVSNTEGGLEISSEFLKNKDIHYNPTNGNFSLQNRFGEPIDFTATYDGKILTLVATQKNVTYFLARVDTATLSMFERFKMEYAQIESNRQLENYKENNRNGFRLKSGKIILPAIYDDINVISHQTLAAKKDGKWALFDYTGRRITDFKYTNLQREKYGYIKCREESAMNGLLDPDGKKILPCQFQLLEMTPNRYIIASQYQANGKETYGVFDEKGKEVLPMLYQQIKMLDQNGDAGAVALLIENNQILKVLFNKNFGSVIL